MDTTLGLEVPAIEDWEPEETGYDTSEYDAACEAAQEDDAR